MLPGMIAPLAERIRLEEDALRTRNWKRWGPYLSERQWGTVREDYSARGDAWDYFPHEHARSRAYRWGEDGLLGICDREGRLCFAFAFWNGRDPILKERLFGVSSTQGNHGEDVKELYYYLDSTPTHSYLQALYKYPQVEFPYGQLLDEARRRGKNDPEYDILESAAFREHRYFDIRAEYAKASPDDILIRLTIANRSREAAPLHVLPTLWFRNTWSWGRDGEGYWRRSRIEKSSTQEAIADHPSLGRFVLAWGPAPDGSVPLTLFTENETNSLRLYGSTNASRFVKDAFHDFVLRGDASAVNPARVGSKMAVHYECMIPAQSEVVLRLRLTHENEAQDNAIGARFDETLAARTREADEFYAELIPQDLSAEEQSVARQAYAGLLWTKQFYHFIVKDWLEGDPAQPPPPKERLQGRNADWPHVYNRDVLSMPDKWEFPWFAAWDLAFHMIPFTALDPDFSKQQLGLLLREWYMHPNGQIPAYEYSFSDVNPPVHAWACWRVYKMTGPRGNRDRLFLSRVFQKLLMNFTWWVNRKDIQGKHVFAGGFLGLDNIGVFDRSKPLPTGGHLEQADGTAWMAFYCSTMLSIALELASEDPAYEDVASKFVEHFVAITDAMNSLGGNGLWDEADGFYYDQIHLDGMRTPLKVRSMVGLLPLIACEVLEADVLERLPGFAKRMHWFMANRADLARHITYLERSAGAGHDHRLLAIPSRERLERVLRTMLDEGEFLSPYGIRSLSRIHRDQDEWRIDYVPGESNSGLFGGNSNWRGPIWFPVNYLLIEALERYHFFYGDRVRVECPTGSGRLMNLGEVAQEIAGRLAGIFLPDGRGRRPCHGDEALYAEDPHFRNLVLFHEYFHGDHGRGLGASHQTGWTALAVKCLETSARARRPELEEEARR
jgi:hypothetical protein